MPTTQQVFEPRLSEWASMYTNGDLYADVVSPIIEEEDEEGIYSIYSKSDMANVARDDLGGERAVANEVDYDITTGTFKTVPRQLMGLVPNKVIRAAKPPHDPERDMIEYVMSRLMLKREIRVANLLDTAANYAAANVLAATAVWTNATTGVPITDIHLAKLLLPPGAPSMGKTKVVLLVTEEVGFALARNPQFRGGGAENGVNAMEDVRELLGVDEILVSNAIKLTSNPGASATYGKVWDKTKARLLRVPVGRPQGKTGLFSATFRWKPDGVPAVLARSWDEPKIGTQGSRAVHASFQDIEKIVQNDMGVLITGVHA